MNISCQKCQRWTQITLVAIFIIGITLLVQQAKAERKIIKNVKNIAALLSYIRDVSITLANRALSDWVLQPPKRSLKSCINVSSKDFR